MGGRLEGVVGREDVEGVTGRDNVSGVEGVIGCDAVSGVAGRDDVSGVDGRDNVSGVEGVISLVFSAVEDAAIMSNKSWRDRCPLVFAFLVALFLPVGL